MPKNIILLLYIVLISCGGGFKDYPASPIDQVNYLDHAQTKTENNITITTSVISLEESDKIFGVDLFAKGIQPVWLEITNNTEVDYVFLPISMDPDYFAPNEVAYLFQGLFGGGKVHPQLSERFNNYGFEIDNIKPGETKNGFVYTNFDPGIKFVNITLIAEDNVETFIFYHVIAEARETVNEIDFGLIYTDDQFVKYKTEDEIRKAIKDLPCCIMNEDGTDETYPVNFIFIGNGEDIFSALIRQGWDVTEPFSDMWLKLDKKKYFASPLFRTTPMEYFYYFNRPQDLSLQKARYKEKGTVRQRNEMRAWLAPIEFNGKSVWVISTTRDVGTDVDKVKDFLTKKIDPDLNETSSFLIEDMVLSQNVNKIGFIGKLPPSSKDNPRKNYKDQVWWFDGLWAVLLFDDKPNSLSDITFYNWDFPNEYLQKYYKEKIDSGS